MIPPLEVAKAGAVTMSNSLSLLTGIIMVAASF